jgi:hypothetical protein
VGSLFALYPYEDDVHVCKHLETISLPREQFGLEWFLSNECRSLDSLLSFEV